MTKPKQPDPKDPRLTAAVELIGRTGAKAFQLRFQDDERPVIWIAVGEWRQASGRTVTSGGTPVWEAAASVDPVTAVVRLCEQVMDGGMCTHCGKPSGVSDDWTQSMPLPGHICWYQYDPELETFRRSCEGE